MGFEARGEALTPRGAPLTHAPALAFSRTRPGEVQVTLGNAATMLVREHGVVGPLQQTGQALSWATSRGSAAWSARGGVVEEWVEVADASEGPVAEWDVTGATLEQAGDVVLVHDSAGVARLLVSAPRALAEGGAEAHAWLRVEGTHLKLFTDARGHALVDPLWASVAPMPTMTDARAWHTATLMVDGKVLVAGGQAGASVLATAEVYDPVLGVWASTPGMATARTRATAVPLRNGKVLLVGGHDGTNFLSSCELYDPAAQSFATTGATSLARADATATLLPDGKVLLAGGLTATGPTTRTETYDPATGFWSTAGALTTARSSHAAVLLPTGHVMVVGGQGASAALSSVELYDPASRVFTAGPPLTYPRAHHTATLGYDGTVVVLGGEQAPGNLVGQSELYSSAGTWSAGCGVAGQMSGHAAALLPDGLVMALRPVTPPPDAQSYGYGFDFSTCNATTGTTWMQDRTTASRGFTLTVLPSGLPLLVGGLTSSGVARANAEVLDARNRTTRVLTDPPVTHELVKTSAPTQYAEATMLLDGRVLFSGGYGGSHEAVLFDPRTENWAGAGTLAGPRSCHSATLLPTGRVVVMGDCMASSEVETFDPTTALWTTAPGLPALLPIGRVTPAFTSQGTLVYPTQGQLVAYDPVAGTVTQLNQNGAPWGVVDDWALVRQLDATHLLVMGVSNTAVLDQATTSWSTAVPSPLVFASATAQPRPVMPFPPDRFTVYRDTMSPAEPHLAAWQGGAFTLLNGFVGMDMWGQANGDLLPGGWPVITSDAFSAEADLGAQNYSYRWITVGGATRVKTLIDGRVVMVVDSNFGGPRALVLDRGVGSRATWAPSIASLPSSAVPGAILTIPGARFTGASDGAAVPIVELSEVNGTRQYALRASSFAPTSLTVTLPPTLLKRAWWVRVISNGVASEARLLRVFAPATATPATATVPPRGTVTFSATGGNGSTLGWSVKSNQSGASIGRTSGTYQAGSTGSVTDVVQVEDVFGALSTASITVKPGVSVNPATTGVGPRAGQSFTATGGAGAPYTWSLTTNASGGTVSAAGAYLAGTTPQVTDVLQATDALGNVGTATISVGPGAALNPSAQTVAPGVARQLGGLGGSGTGYVFTFDTNASGGTLSSGGAYVAGAAAGVDVVRVTDSVGNTGTGTIAVVLSPALVVYPTTAARPPRGTVSFGVSGGSGLDYQWSLPTNASGATIDALTGAYQAGATGSVGDVVRVTDSYGNHVDIAVSVGPAVWLTPSAATVAPHAPQQFSAQGGSDAGFVFSLPTNGSGGTVGVAGAYVAGGTPGSTDVVRVTDSLGNLASATVTVGPGVSVSPATVTVYAGRNQAFVAQGGADAGFAWSLSTNGSGGSVGAASGVYVAGNTGPTSDVVRVVDPYGNAATATVTVLPGVTVVPTAANLTPGALKAFTASGGSNFGFTWSLVTNASGGSVGTSSGVYRAGPTGNVIDVLRVTDSDGNTAQATIRLGASLELTPGSTSLAPRASQAFLASGGSGASYVYSLATSASGAVIDAATGQYRAGDVGSVADVVKVVDSLGNVATATVSVGPALALTPAAASLAPRGAQRFSTQGGSGAGVTFTLPTNASGGTLDASTGAYVAGPTGGVTDVVRATDSLGNVATTSVVVTAALSVTPAHAALAPRAGQTFSAQGGANSGFTWSLPTNASHGTLDAATGAYLAGPTGGVTDVVQVADALGNTATASVEVGAALAIAPAAPTVAPRAPVDFTASGGSGQGLAWTLVDNRSQGSVEASTGRYHAGPTGSVADVVRVTDSLGNTATVTVQVGPGLTVSPAQVTVDTAHGQAFTAQGGSGAGFTWALATNASGATLDAATGAYTAGQVANVVDVVQVTDGLGNRASAQVTVKQGLAVVPERVSVAVHGTQPFAAVGGSGGGYAWALAVDGSGGSITADGRYTAGGTGNVTDVVEVTDSGGHTARATVTVLPPLVVTPSEATVAPGTTLALTVSGGSGEGYAWTLASNLSGASMDGASGVYEAGRTNGVDDVVEVRDSVGNTRRVTISVRAASVVKSGCGCGGVDGAWPLAGLALLGLAARRRR